MTESDSDRLDAAPPLADALLERAVHGGSRDYAGFLRRAAAAVMDLWFLILAVPLLWIVFAAAYLFLDQLLSGRLGPLIDPVAGRVMLVIVLVGVFGLTAGGEASNDQATLGKTFCNLKVTDVFGQRISWRRSMVRFVVKLGAVWLAWLLLDRTRRIRLLPNLGDLATLGGFLIAPYLLQLVTPRRQALHDLIAGTLVLHCPKRRE